MWFRDLSVTSTPPVSLSVWEWSTRHIKVGRTSNWKIRKFGGIDPEKSGNKNDSFNNQNYFNVKLKKICARFQNFIYLFINLSLLHYMITLRVGYITFYIVANYLSDETNYFKDLHLFRHLNAGIWLICEVNLDWILVAFNLSSLRKSI